MFRGAVWLMIGAAVTLFTYSAARQQGGSFLIAYGAIIGGLAMFFKGPIHRLRKDRHQRTA